MYLIFLIGPTLWVLILNTSVLALSKAVRLLYNKQTKTIFWSIAKTVKFRNRTRSLQKRRTIKNKELSVMEEKNTFFPCCMLEKKKKQQQQSFRSMYNNKTSTWFQLLIVQIIWGWLTCWPGELWEWCHILQTGWQTH